MGAGQQSYKKSDVNKMASLWDGKVLIDGGQLEDWSL
jgi:hypothetical protein